MVNRCLRARALACILAAGCNQDAELAAVPGHDLVYPHATLLSQGISGVQGRAGAPATSHHYGSNDEASDPLVWWDEQLARLGYGPRNAKPTPTRLRQLGARQGGWEHPTGHWYSVSIAAGPCLTKGVSHPYKRCIYQEVLPRKYVD